MINTMAREFGPRFHFETNYAQMTSLIRGSRVNMNCAYKDDLNFRYFEVLGLGVELVTDSVPDLLNVPGLAECCTVYKDFEEMPGLVRNVLDGKIRHDMVGIQNWIRENHCINHRYRQLIAELAQ
jgi:spore maturation protein CgeB